MNKHALCVGINDYPGTQQDLAGCVNDANDWSALLAARGFPVQRLLNEQATRGAMVGAIRDVIGRAGAGDLVVITFSGHGTYEFDLGGDEIAGYDQALCPYDIETAGEALVDDDIRALFDSRRPGARMVLIADSCHSGSVNRALGKRAAPLRRFLPPQVWMPAARFAKLQARVRAVQVPAAAPLHALEPDEGDLLMAGCEDRETNFSYDANFAGRPNGAFTYFALRALAELPAGATYDDWHEEIRRALPSISYPQKPQLAGSAAARGRAVLS